MKVVNANNKEINILHFQGRSLETLKDMFNLVKNNVQLAPLEPNLTIVSCWTDDTKCHLLQQLNKFGINLVNAVPDNYDRSVKWDMTNKIQFYIEYLKEKVKTDYVLLLDGYDVLLTSTIDIVKRFKATGYRIIFNTTYNKYPKEDIEVIENRRNKLGDFQYFNAGCCIGYREDLIKFYTECLNYKDIPNPARSEQKILRHCFANYSNDPLQKFIWLDTNRIIFHTMAHTEYSYVDDVLTITDKKRLFEKIITIKEVEDKTLREVIESIAVPIIKRNREQGWIDDNFNDILYEFNQHYITDAPDLYKIIKELIR